MINTTFMSLVCVVVGMSAQAAATPRTIDQGTHSSIGEPRQVVVRTDSEWEKLWREHLPDRPRPPVDFSKEMVVAVFLGSKPTPGYRVTIDSVVTTTIRGQLKPNDPGATTVRYRETAPPRGVISAQVITFPYHIVSVPRRSGTDVKFEKIQ